MYIDSLTYDQCSIRFVMVSSHLGFSLSGFLTGLVPALPLEELAHSVVSDFCDSSTYSSSFACSLSIFAFWSYTPEQKEEEKKALAAGVPKATILTYFYPEVTVEKMSSYRKKQ